MVSAHDLEDLQTASAHVQIALDGMGVASWSGPQLVVRHLMSALRLEGSCNGPDNHENDVSRPQHILAVEYTRKSMSAVMWGEECVTTGGPLGSALAITDTMPSLLAGVTIMKTATTVM